jgi:ABC-type lipoprotein export system ATPase subunit
MNTGNNIIEVSNLCKTYFKGKVEIPAVKNVSYKFPEGKITSIVGKSGSGKSTLLNMIGGLDIASSGKIDIDGKDLLKMSRYELALHRRFSVGMVFQSFNLISSRNALQNVMLALAFGGVARKERKEKARQLLDSVGLTQRINHKPSELSGGEAQRVAIARALANNPKVLLADELTGNLDSNTSNEIIDLLLNLNKEKKLTILMVTHDQETAERVSDGIVKLKDGMVE